MRIVITESQKESLKKNLNNLFNRYGFVQASKAVGSANNLVRILFNGDFGEVGEDLKPPYFETLKRLKIPNEHWVKILSRTFDKPISVSMGRLGIYDDDGNEIYSEKFGGWEISKYDDDGNEIYNEKDDGTWTKSFYDKDGNLLSKLSSEGLKSTFDKDGSLVDIDSIDD